MSYSFYIQKDGQELGPYSAYEILKLKLADNIMISEESMGEWLPAANYDFKDMARKELREKLNSSEILKKLQSSEKTSDVSIEIPIERFIRYD